MSGRDSNFRPIVPKARALPVVELRSGLKMLRFHDRANSISDTLERKVL